MNNITDIKIATIGNVDSGKCFARNTLLMMYDTSFKNVQDLLVGDLLMGDDNTPRRILSVYTGYGQLYTINQDNGIRYTVNINHILVLIIDNKIMNMTVGEYLATNPQNCWGFRKKDLHTNSVILSKITIQKADSNQYWGFQVNGNKKFLLSDLTVAHNSTIIGTLMRGVNDDGRGSNREMVMNFKHEKETGQTSSIGYQLVGFRGDGSIINVENKNRKQTWPKIMKECAKIVTFMDLAGHEKYLKTTIHGLSCNHPDYTLILVEGRGIRGMTKEHLMLALSFDIPIIIIITKVDLYSKDEITLTITQLLKLLKSAKKECCIVRELVDIEIPLQQTGHYIPIFSLSNVTGIGINLFREYLYRLPKRLDYSCYIDDPAEMAVLEAFSVDGIGTVAHCFIVRGTVRLNDVVWVGPDTLGNYHKTKIRTMQYKRINVDFALPGNHITISIPNIERKLLRQGVYILHDDVPNKLAVRTFTADVKILTTNSITIKIGYMPMLNIDNIKMAAKVLKISTIEEPITNIEYLRGGGKARILFQFAYSPVYLRDKCTFVFREGKTKGWGKVVDIN